MSPEMLVVERVGVIFVLTSSCSTERMKYVLSVSENSFPHDCKRLRK